MKERKDYRMILGYWLGKLEELEEWNWFLLNGKVGSKSRFGSLGNLSENFIYMDVWDGNRDEVGLEIWSY